MTKSTFTASQLNSKESRRKQNQLVLAKSNKRQLIWQKIGSFLTAVVRYALLIGLGFLILSPILKMDINTAKHPLELGSPVPFGFPRGQVKSTSRWPIKRSITGRRCLTRSLTVTLQVFLQVFSAALAGYSFARLKFRGQKFLFACVILTIVVPAQAISLPQYLNFRFFDIFGISEAITGEPMNLLGVPLGFISWQLQVKA